MYERTRDLLLRLLKVPLQPHPPAGDPASVRVFRAGRNYYKLRLALWGLTQAAALAGIVFWAVVLVQVEDTARTERRTRVSPHPLGPQAGNRTTARPSADETEPGRSWKESLKSAAAAAKNQPGREGWAGFKRVLVEIALILPAWAFPLIWVLKISGFALYLAQIPLTYAVRRLDYEMHWYIVTDRSLRLRTGVWNVQELTMSFANLQQVIVTQGPLQRLLGIADVRVQSAGGAGTELTRAAQQQSLHSGYFHSVDNATEIRDLILERLRRFRESGLGDPDEIRRHPPVAPARPARPPADPSAELLASARALRDEARALRLALA